MGTGVSWAKAIVAEPHSKPTATAMIEKRHADEGKSSLATCRLPLAASSVIPPHRPVSVGSCLARGRPGSLDLRPGASSSAVCSGVSVLVAPTLFVEGFGAVVDLLLERLEELELGSRRDTVVVAAAPAASTTSAAAPAALPAAGAPIGLERFEQLLEAIGGALGGLFGLLVGLDFLRAAWPRRPSSRRRGGGSER